MFGNGVKLVFIKQLLFRQDCAYNKDWTGVPVGSAPQTTLSYFEKGCQMKASHLGDKTER